jgi:hypothetical protein
MNQGIDATGHKPEHSRWNQWETAVKKRGMERTLAELGREVIRDADQHNWAPELRNLCSGPSLEKLLLGAPFLGRRLCEILLETDGLRVATPETDERKNDVIRLAGFGGLY